MLSSFVVVKHALSLLTKMDRQVAEIAAAIPADELPRETAAANKALAFVLQCKVHASQQSTEDMTNAATSVPYAAACRTSIVESIRAFTQDRLDSERSGSSRKKFARGHSLALSSNPDSRGNLLLLSPARQGSTSRGSTSRGSTRAMTHSGRTSVPDVVATAMAFKRDVRSGSAGSSRTSSRTATFELPRPDGGSVTVLSNTGGEGHKGLPGQLNGTDAAQDPLTSPPSHSSSSLDSPHDDDSTLPHCVVLDTSSQAGDQVATSPRHSEELVTDATHGRSSPSQPARPTEDEASTEPTVHAVGGEEVTAAGLGASTERKMQAVDDGVGKVEAELERHLSTGSAGDVPLVPRTANGSAVSMWDSLCPGGSLSPSLGEHGDTAAAGTSDISSTGAMTHTCSGEKLAVAAESSTVLDDDAKGAATEGVRVASRKPLFALPNKMMWRPAYQRLGGVRSMVRSTPPPAELLDVCAKIDARSVVNAVPQAALVTTLKGVILQSNANMSHHFGYEAKALHGHNVAALLAPDCLLRVQSLTRGLVSSRSEGSVERCNATVVSCGGVSVEVALSITLRKISGRDCMVVSIMPRHSSPHESIKARAGVNGASVSMD